MKAFTDTYNLCLGAVVAALTAVFGIYPISENELEGITLTPEQALGIEPIMEVVE